VLSELQEKSPLKYTFAQKLSCLNPKGMATESSEGNITAFRGLVRHLNEARRRRRGCRFSHVTVQEIPGGGSSSEQVLSFLIAVTWLINYTMGLLAGSDDYCQLWSIVKMVLLLSYGCG